MILGLPNMPPRLPKSPDSEKLTLNLGFIDLGQIELLVREGFYSNRSDFIRTAIRRPHDAQSAPVAAALSRQTLELGLCAFGRADLEAAVARGEQLAIRVVGLARIAPDVTPELARAAIGSLTVLGALQASPAVRAALADRLT
jgi:Arc/MetJ-type ribon-helix-helix transcriptional regulator